MKAIISVSSMMRWRSENLNSRKRQRSSRSSFVKAAGWTNPQDRQKLNGDSNPRAHTGGKAVDSVGNRTCEISAAVGGEIDGMPATQFRNIISMWVSGIAIAK